MSSNMAAAHSALKLGFFISSLTIASLGARLATADISPSGEARALGLSTARATGGDLSDRALRQIFNADNSALFARHDPGLKQTAPLDILKGYEQGAPLSHWDLPPQTAEVVNQGVPISSDPILPAKPFILKAAAGDREAAVTCLTQAVYYEAGFEPIEGAQAVAQVVLNRVRHPIFPKSVCGVVYQGGGLKTGCQFSFTCDGSLAKTPAAGAWARAKAVAEKALGGYVAKNVGEATHYHTNWVLPWWAPTVTKIGQVGTQIFYRWPGQLGMPTAFNGRYAGGEQVGRDMATGTDAGAQTARAGADGRLHVIIAAAAAPVIAAPTVTKMDAMPMDLASIKADGANIELPAPHPARAQVSYMPPTFVGCIAGPCRP